MASVSTPLGLGGKADPTLVGGNPSPEPVALIYKARTRKLCVA